MCFGMLTNTLMHVNSLVNSGKYAYIHRDVLKPFQCWTVPSYLTGSHPVSVENLYFDVVSGLAWVYGYHFAWRLTMSVSRSMLAVFAFSQMRHFEIDPIL